MIHSGNCKFVDDSHCFFWLFLRFLWCVWSAEDFFCWCCFSFPSLCLSWTLLCAVLTLTRKNLVFFALSSSLFLLLGLNLTKLIIFLSIYFISSHWFVAYFLLILVVWVCFRGIYVYKRNFHTFWLIRNSLFVDNLWQ